MVKLHVGISAQIITMVKIYHLFSENLPVMLKACLALTLAMILNRMYF